MAYQGRQPGVGVRNRFIYSATNGQTSFSGADSNGLTLAYADATYVDVFLNGTLLVPVTDYAATTKTSVVLGSGAAASDIVEIVAYDISSMSGAVNKTGDSMTGDLSFGDSDKAIFGAGSDLQIYHDGNDSWIYDSGSGNLNIRANDFQVINSANTQAMIYAAIGGAVNLYYAGASKLATTSTGIAVTGTVAATAYTGDGSNLTGVGSPSIDDNGVATVITIDSSDRVLTDTTNVSAIAQTGNSMTYDNGRLEVQKYRASALKVGNYTDAYGAFSGSLIELYTGGTAVGSIGTVSNTVGIHGAGSGDDAVGLVFVESGSSQRIIPCQESFTANNGIVNLGWSTNRFKDLYLSGGVYLGGTGTANHLDDYEEGTWTPVLGGGWTTNSGTWAATGSYTKIGNLVTVSFKHTAGNMSWNVGASLTGLPFSGPTSAEFSGTWINDQPNAGGQLLGWGTTIYFAQAGSAARGPDLGGRLTYRV